MCPIDPSLRCCCRCVISMADPVNEAYFLRVSANPIYVVCNIPVHMSTTTVVSLSCNTILHAHRSLVKFSSAPSSLPKVLADFCPLILYKKFSLCNSHMTISACNCSCTPLFLTLSGYVAGCQITNTNAVQCTVFHQHILSLQAYSVDGLQK